jgi:hypothetical protein
VSPIETRQRIAKLRRLATRRIASANKAEDKYGKTGAYRQVQERATWLRVLAILDGKS